MSTAEQIETERNALIKLIKDSQARNLLLKMALMEEDLIIIGYLTHSKFYWVSPSWTSLLGYSFKELTQTDFFEFIHPEDIENSRYAFEHLISEGQLGFKRVFPNRYRKKDGDYVYIGWHDFVVLDQETDKFSMRATQITEQQYEEALKSVEYLWKG